MVTIVLVFKTGPSLDLLVVGSDSGCMFGLILRLSMKETCLFYCQRKRTVPVFISNAEWIQDLASWNYVWPVKEKLAFIAINKSCISMYKTKKKQHANMFLDCVCLDSCCPLCFAVRADEEAEEDEEDLGGLFRVSRPHMRKRLQANAMDCSRFSPDTYHNWDSEEVNPVTQGCSLVLLICDGIQLIGNLKWACFAFRC